MQTALIIIIPVVVVLLIIGILKLKPLFSALDDGREHLKQQIAL